MRLADDGEAELGFRVVDRVSPDRGTARPLQDFRRAFEDLAQQLEGNFSRGQPTRLSAKSGLPPIA